jgi:DNA-binding XRE family transcriptional regulator
MSKPQIIKTETGEELIVLSRRDYDAMRARLGDDDAEDRMTARIIRESKASGGVAAPLSVWDEIEVASSPIGPLRKWRKLTQEELAAKAGISQGYLSELETGRKTGDLATLHKVAAALGVGLADVTRDETEV